MEVILKPGAVEIVEYEDEMLIRIPILADGVEVGEVIYASEDEE